MLLRCHPLFPFRLLRHPSHLPIITIFIALFCRLFSSFLIWRYPFYRVFVSGRNCSAFDGRLFVPSFFVSIFRSPRLSLHLIAFSILTSSILAISPISPIRLAHSSLPVPLLRHDTPRLVDVFLSVLHGFVSLVAYISSHFQSTTRVLSTPLLSIATRLDISRHPPISISLIIIIISTQPSRAARIDSLPTTSSPLS